MFIVRRTSIHSGEKYRMTHQRCGRRRFFTPRAACLLEYTELNCKVFQFSSSSFFRFFFCRDLHTRSSTALSFIRRCFIFSDMSGERKLNFRQRNKLNNKTAPSRASTRRATLRTGLAPRYLFKYLYSCGATSIDPCGPWLRAEHGSSRCAWYYRRWCSGRWKRTARFPPAKGLR